MKHKNGIVFCMVQCYSDNVFDEIESEETYLEEFAFDVDDLTAIRKRDREDEFGNSAIYMKSGESFVVNVHANELLKLWRNHKAKAK